MTKLSRRQEPPRPLPWWTVMVGLLVAAASTLLAIVWLLHEARNAPNSERAGVRIDAVRTGLGVGAGVGGLAALLIAARRQWHIERDSAEQRVTDLYAKAADQLGNDKAPVRLAALYALQRLALGNREHRQSIINLVCAYLRMPFGLHGGRTTAEPVSSEAGRSEEVENVVKSRSVPDTSFSPHEELQVRLAAQRILAELLRADMTARFSQRTTPRSVSRAEQPNGGFAVDLSGAVLVELDLAGCRLGVAKFNRALLSGEADFRNAEFCGQVEFDTATFDSGVDFMGSRFWGVARFEGATFEQEAWFCEAEFHENAMFSKASIHGNARFDDATFRCDAQFEEAMFDADARFDKVEFQLEADFEDAAVRGAARFEDAIFHGDIRFSNGRFEGAIQMSNARVLNYSGLVSRSFPRGWIIRALRYDQGIFVEESAER